nr:MAG TPA: hypothetical protein [Caudoviricetes sp.]
MIIRITMFHQAGFAPARCPFTVVLINTLC